VPNTLDILAGDTKEKLVTGISPVTSGYALWDQRKDIQTLSDQENAVVISLKGL